MASPAGRRRARHAAAPTTDLIDAAHQRLLREDWELALCITDLPLRVGRRPGGPGEPDASRRAVLSLPALGAARLRRRALDTAVGLLGILEPCWATAARRSSAWLVIWPSWPTRIRRTGPAASAALARGGRLRLLAGMVRANRPWRLAAGSTGALVAALAAVAFALVTSDVWRIAASLRRGAPGGAHRPVAGARPWSP